MKLIKDIFARQIDRKIEEVIKIDQHDTETVRQEIEEYVLTDAIKEHFYQMYEAILDYNRQPHEGVGVWVSGFFGSGKSSFAKLLGYTLANLPIAEKSASERFIDSARDEKISNYLSNLNSRFKIHAVIFDVSMDRGVRTASDRITEVMYKVLLRQLDYPEDFDLAEMEIMLENDNCLEKFEKIYKKKYEKDWSKGKKIVTNALNESSNILHEIYPDKYTTPDSWLLSLGKEGRADIDPNKLSKLTFELVERRKPGYGIIYIIDEVGQYVARSTEKMLDLQAIIQALGKESKNRVKANKSNIPAWAIVTSQEKLEEVVDALDARRIELARLQDRFPIPIDLKQSDIREVTAKRVLDKKDEAKKILEKLYNEYEGRIKTNTTLERTHRNTTCTNADFIELYPYLPYQIELSINIVAGLRLKRGAQRHVGGSNRTIIKQAQQMLIHPQTNLGDKPLGALVTLDMIYELLYGGSLLPSEITQEIDSIKEHIPNNEMAIRVAKAVALLEVVRDLPRTEHNIAVVLHPSIKSDSLENEVKQALKELKSAQFIRETQDGYKLLTVQEKNWDTERRGLKPKERNKIDIIEEVTRSIFSEPSLRTYRYKNLSTFRVGITINSRSIADGTVHVLIHYCDEPNQVSNLKEEIRTTSRSNQDEIFWVFGLTDEIHSTLTEIYRSRAMIQDYSRLQSQNQITREEMACLEDERQQAQRSGQNLKSILLKSLESGIALFRGIEKDGSFLGSRLLEMMRTMLSAWIPDIYPKLEMGARNMTGKEAEQILTSANLKALPQIFYDSADGLNLITKRGEKYLPNAMAPVAQEVFQYLKQEFDYGNSVTGKIIEGHFNKPPYGWERDVLRLVLALLFRAGLLEVTSQGQKYKSYSSPNARIPLINQTTFRSATFAPKETIDLKTLTSAAKYFEEITGKEVDVDESVIDQEFKKILQSDFEALKETLFKLNNNGLPGNEELEIFKSDLDSVLAGTSEDSVRFLAGSGATYKSNNLLLNKLSNTLTDQTMAVLKKGQQVISHLWPVLKEHGLDGDLEDKIQKLTELYYTTELYEHMDLVDDEAKKVFSEYEKKFKEAHQNRMECAEKGIETIKAHPLFINLNPTEHDMLLNPFVKRICKDDQVDWNGYCSNCQASLQQLESDIYSIDGLIQAASQKIIELTTEEEEQVVTVTLQKYFHGNYQSVDEFTAELDKLKSDIEKLIAEGKKVYFK